MEKIGWTNEIVRVDWGSANRTRKNCGSNNMNQNCSELIKIIA